MARWTRRTRELVVGKRANRASIVFNHLTHSAYYDPQTYYSHLREQERAASKQESPDMASAASSSRLNGALSPPLPRSSASSPPRQKYPEDQLRPYMRSTLAKTLQGARWDSADKAKMASYSKEVAERVKARMMEIEPRGWKYVVTCTLSENLGQAGRADMSCHWEETDVAVQEMWSNDTIIFVCVAWALRVV